MTRAASRGHTLVELLVAMAIATTVAAIVFPALLTLQARSLAEVSRTDLRARADRLLRFLAEEVRDAAFLVGAVPRRSGGAAPVLIHDSRPGNPAESLDFALLAEDGGEAGDDALTVVKAVSFFPPLKLTHAATVGDTVLRLDRRPNQSPGSSREVLPAPEAISHVVPANQRFCYPVAGATQALPLLEGLAVAVPIATELLGVRARRIYLDRPGASGRLRWDDFTSDEILDQAVDGLQFEYLLADGRIVDRPDDPRLIRGVRLSLLVRDHRADPDYRDTRAYRLGNRRYGPYNDRFRRVAVSELIEVRNHGLP